MLVSLAFNRGHHIIPHELLLENENFRVLEHVQTYLLTGTELLRVDVTLLVHSQNCSLLAPLHIVACTALQEIKLFLALHPLARVVVLNPYILQRKEHILFHNVLLSQPDQRRNRLFAHLDLPPRLVVDFNYCRIFHTLQMELCHYVDVSLSKLRHDLLFCQMHDSSLHHSHYLLLVPLQVETFD